MNIWERLECQQRKFPEDFSSPINISVIKKAEEKINLSFSDGYLLFIKKYGSAAIGAYYINAFKNISLMGKTNYTVVDKTLFYKEKQKWPGIDDWYIISDDGRGNPIGCKPDGSVWLSDHDAGFEQIKLADDFEQFLEKILDDTLYD